MKRVQLIAQGLMLFGLLTQGSAALLAKPVSVTLIPAESKVSFEGKSRLLNFEGEGSGVTGSFKISGAKAIEGQATFPLNNLKTGLDTRDEHMKNKEETGLTVQKFPEAKFIPTLLPWEDPSQVLAKETKDGHFEGKLVLRGVENPVQGNVSTTVSGDKVTYTFKFQVLLPHHKIVPPSFSGVTVKDDIDVTVVTPAKVVAQ